MCETVDLPRVPVTPTIFAPASVAYFEKSAVDIATGTPAARAAVISGESSRTPADLMTRSHLRPPKADPPPEEKSSFWCPPRRKVIFGYFLSRSNDSVSCSSVFVSVTTTSAPHCAKNSASPTPRPRSPRPSSVTCFPLKNSSYGFIGNQWYTAPSEKAHGHGL